MQENTKADLERQLQACRTELAELAQALQTERTRRQQAEEALQKTERKQAETELYQREQTFRALAENAPDIIARIDRQLRHFYVNAAVETVTGLSPQDFIGKTNRELGMPEAQCNDWEEMAQQVFMTGVERIVEFDFITPDGTTRYFQSRLVPEFGQDGSIESILGISRDVTDFKQTADALRESQQLLQAILDAAPVAIYLKDLQGRYLLVNPYTQQALGLAQEQIVGKSDYELIGQDLVDNWRSQERAALEAGMPVAIEDSLLQADGLHTYITTKFPLYDAAGTPYAIGGISIDITQRKQAEQALYRREQEFRTLAENAPDIIARLDKQLRHLYVNAAAEPVTGLFPQEFIGKSWRELEMPEALYTSWEENFQRVFTTAQEQTLEYDLPTPDGTAKYYQTRLMPEFARDGSVESILVVTRDVTDFKQTEAALRESEERFRQLAENIDAVFWVFCLNEQKTLYISPAYEKIWGRSSQPLYENSQNWMHTIYPEDRDIDAAIYERLNSGELVEDIYQIVKPDGSVRWIRDRAFPVYDSQGRLYRAAGIAEDITERKQAELALRESEERFRQLAENIDAVFWIFCLDERKLLYISPAYDKIWGRPRERLYKEATRWREGVHPEDVPAIVASAQQQLQGEFPERVYRIIRPDGSIRWLQDHTFPIYNSEGRLYRTAGISEDITERKQAEAALQESEQKYRNLVETAQGLIWSVDSAGRFSFINQASKHFYGYEPEEMIGREATEFTTPEQAQKDMEALRRVLAGESLLQYETMAFRKDGTPFYISTNAIVIRDEAGNVLGTTGTSIDITERKRAEEELKASLQEKEALLKEVHHRVKNNLQVISSLLDLQSQRIEDALDLEAFRASQNRVKSIAIIHEKLYQSKNLAQVNLAEYIHTLTNYLYQTYPINPDNITLQLKVDDIFLNLDTVIPCGLIINELISNALKHGFPGNTRGTIWIELNCVSVEPAEENTHQVTLVIGNDGIKLEDPTNFYRAKSLGFQLVQILVKQLYGQIEIDQSRGTEFKIRFSEQA